MEIGAEEKYLIDDLKAMAAAGANAFVIIGVNTDRHRSPSMIATNILGKEDLTDLLYVAYKNSSDPESRSVGGNDVRVSHLHHLAGESLG